MPLLWLSVSFLAGLVAGYTWRWDGWALLATGLTLAAALLSRLPERFKRPAFTGWMLRPHAFLRVAPLALLAVLAWGAWRVGAALAVPPDSPPALLNERGLFRMRGVVSGPPDRREQSTLLHFSLDSAVRLDQDGQPVGKWMQVRGLALLVLPAGAGWRYGDRLEIDGLPETPAEASANDSFSYRDYLKRQGISCYIVFPKTRRDGPGAGNPLWRAIFWFREQAYQEIYRLFPFPEAPLLAGILLGLERDLPPDLSQAFQDTGTAHIIAISGFNIALLASLFSMLFTALLGRVLSRWWVLALTILALAGYTLMAGAGASVVRAAIMGSMALISTQLGRRPAGMAGFSTLAFTAAVMCLFNPLLPWDGSFQLSFAATLGLMLYASGLQEGFIRLATLRLPLPLARKLAGPASEYFLSTLAAQITTLPVILYSFQRLSISALLVNPLVLPAQPLLMALGGAAVLGGLLFEPLGWLLASAAMPLITYTIRVIETFALLPGGVLKMGELDPVMAGLLFAVVTLPAFMAGFFSKIPERVKSWASPVLALAACGLLAAFLARWTLAMPDGRLHLTIFEGGAYPVLLVQAPDGSRVLVNVGNSANHLSAALGARFAPFDRRIDALIVANCAPEALEPLPFLLERFNVQGAWWGCAPSSAGGKALDAALDDAHVNSRSLLAGERLLLGGEVTLQVLSAGTAHSGVLLEWRSFRAVLPGGVAPGSLGREAQMPGVLALGAGALEDSPPHAWSALGAQAVVVSPPESSGLSLPVEWVKLGQREWVSIITDGERMWVEVGFK